MVSNYVQFSRDRFKFVEKLADSILSEFSSDTETQPSSDNAVYDPPKYAKQKNFDFIRAVVRSNDVIDERLKQMYV